MADVVLNHKAAADKLETFEVVEVDPEDRTQEISEPFEIEGWTHFTFDGRNKAYNDFEWHWYHFNGTDFDAKVIKVVSILSKVTTKVGQTTTWLTMRMVTLTTLCMLT